jgi:hypothetical protein
MSFNGYLVTIVHIHSFTKRDHFQLQRFIYFPLLLLCMVIVEVTSLESLDIQYSTMVSLSILRALPSSLPSLHQLSVQLPTWDRDKDQVEMLTNEIIKRIHQSRDHLQHIDIWGEVHPDNDEPAKAEPEKDKLRPSLSSTVLPMLTTLFIQGRSPSRLSMPHTPQLQTLTIWCDTIELLAILSNTPLLTNLTWKCALVHKARFKRFAMSSPPSLSLPLVDTTTTTTATTTTVSSTCRTHQLSRLSHVRIRTRSIEEMMILMIHSGIYGNAAIQRIQLSIRKDNESGLDGTTWYTANDNVEEKEVKVKDLPSILLPSQLLMADIISSLSGLQLLICNEPLPPTTLSWPAYGSLLLDRYSPIIPSSILTYDLMTQLEPPIVDTLITMIIRHYQKCRSPSSTVSNDKPTSSSGISSSGISHTSGIDGGLPPYPYRMPSLRVMRVGDQSIWLTLIDAPRLLTLSMTDPLLNLDLDQKEVLLSPIILKWIASTNVAAVDSKPAKENNNNYNRMIEMMNRIECLSRFPLLQQISLWIQPNELVWSLPQEAFISEEKTKEHDKSGSKGGIDSMPCSLNPLAHLESIECGATVSIEYISTILHATAASTSLRSIHFQPGWTGNQWTILHEWSSLIIPLLPLSITRVGPFRNHHEVKQALLRLPNLKHISFVMTTMANTKLIYHDIKLYESKRRSLVSPSSTTNSTEKSDDNDDNDDGIIIEVEDDNDGGQEMYLTDTNESEWLTSEWKAALLTEWDLGSTSGRPHRTDDDDDNNINYHDYASDDHYDKTNDNDNNNDNDNDVYLQDNANNNDNRDDSMPNDDLL